MTEKKNENLESEVKDAPEQDVKVATEKVAEKTNEVEAAETRVFFLVSLFLIIACSSDNESDKVEEVVLEPITSEVLYFIYTADTGNNSSKLEYQIKFINPNNQDINGFVRITINADGLVSSLIGSDKSQCYFIAKNDECIFTFEAEDSHDLGKVNNIELVSLEYILEQ